MSSDELIGLGARWGRGALALACAALVSACASAGVGSFEAPPEGAVFSGRSGARLSLAEADALLLQARVVLVGEQHGDAASHAAQRSVLERVVALHGRDRVVVGVEWLPASARLAMQGWLATDEPVSSLAVATRWAEVWGHPIEAYTPLLLAIRALGVPLAPLNAEPGLARLVAREGVDGVPAERKSELPPLDTANEAHRAWFIDTMKAMAEAHGGHGSFDDARLERLYLAQLVWDETMAANTRTLAGDKVVVVFAGRGHVERALGVPARLADLPYLVILPLAKPEDTRELARDATFPERPADLLWLAR